MVDKNFDIVGIGNSIVDVIADIDDQYLVKHDLMCEISKVIPLLILPNNPVCNRTTCE